MNQQSEPAPDGATPEMPAGAMHEQEPEQERDEMPRGSMEEAES